MFAAFSPLWTYCLFVIFVVGLCMGSFLNCLAWRMTHGESVLHGRSHCTSCGHVLGARDLVPVLSWVLSRGRCRYCGSPVSARYPATELICGLVYASLFVRYGPTLEACELIAFASVLLVLSLTDLDDYIIPNKTIVAALVIRVVYLVTAGALGLVSMPAAAIDAVVGGLAVGLSLYVLTCIMDRVLGRASFGGGDIKLLFVAGAYFGWQQCLFLIPLACVIGLLFGLISPSRGRTSANDSAPEYKAEEVHLSDTHAVDDKSIEPSGKQSAGLIPFGPAIALSCWVTMLVGQQVLNWYLSFVHF